MRIGYGISVAGSNQRNFVSAQAEQVIWKVAVFGAGTASSNGEYVWDGNTLVSGKPKYDKTTFDANIQFVDGQWELYDEAFDGLTYTSTNLISWTPSAGSSPAPSSALSYAQNSFISSITLVGGDVTDINCTYNRASGGFTEFVGQATGFGNASIYHIPEEYYNWFATDGDETKYASLDLFSWDLIAGATAPTVSAVVYSA